jgi:formyltetrahydrofolate synthetase
LLKAKSKELDVPIVSSTHWADGGAGAKELAEVVVKTIDEAENNFRILVS